MKYTISIVLMLFAFTLIGQEHGENLISLKQRNGYVILSKDNLILDTIIHTGRNFEVIDYKVHSKDSIDVMYLRNNDSVLYSNYVYDGKYWGLGRKSKFVVIFRNNNRLLRSKRKNAEDEISFSEIDKSYLFKIEKDRRVSFIRNGKKQYIPIH